MAIETIRISKAGRDQLLTLKRRTKIATWNVLCRWAFCVSIRERTTPHALAGETDGAIEISLGTLFGAHVGVYVALLRMRCKQDGLPLTDDNLNAQLRLHVHRGISYLAGAKDLASIRDLCASAIPSSGIAGASKSKRAARAAVA